MSWIRHFEPWEIAVCDFLGAQKARMHAAHDATVGPDQPRYQRLGHPVPTHRSTWDAEPEVRAAERQSYERQKCATPL